MAIGILILTGTSSLLLWPVSQAQQRDAESAAKSGARLSGSGGAEVSEAALQKAGLGDYALYQRAQKLLDQSRKDEAERLFRQVAQEYPGSILNRSAILQAAGAAALRGAHQQTIDDVTPLLAKNDGTGLRLAIEALTRLNRRDEALRSIRQLYFDAPQSAEAEKATELLSALGIEKIGGEATQWRRRADKLFQSGLWVVAARAYEEYAQLFPGESRDEVSLRAGISFYRGNSFREASDALRRVRSNHPKTTIETNYYLAMALLSLEDEESALQALEKLRQAAAGKAGTDGSREADLLYSFGRYHEKRDRPEKSEIW